MPTTFYAINGPTASAQARAALLGCVVCMGDPSGGLVTVFPSAVVMSSALPTAIFPDDTGEATLAQVQTAFLGASAAEGLAAQPWNAFSASIPNASANQQTVRAKVQTGLGALETWIANNPNGAVLTATQTLAVIRMLAGLCRLLLGELNTTGGA